MLAVYADEFDHPSPTLHFDIQYMVRCDPVNAQWMKTGSRPLWLTKLL